MAKFDLKKAILENKATFFSSLTEGQFSWFTQDTNQQIGSQDENQIPVYMFDDKGKYYYENDYDGYGVFGGMDYYELLDKMNGGEGDRGRGIDLAFGKEKTSSEVLFPALVTKPDKFNYRTHNFAVEPESDPNQSWYTPEEDDFYDQNDEEEYGDNEDEDDDMMEGLNVKEMDVQNNDEVEEFLDGMINMSIPEDSEEGEEVKDVWEESEYADEDAYGEAAQEFTNTHKHIMDQGGEITIEGNPDVTYKALPNGDIQYSLIVTLDEGKKKYYKDAEADDAEHIKALEKDMKDDKKSSKMKKSELKDKIKEMILKEMEDEKVVDVNDETPESEEDFLAELEGMLSEAEDEDTEEVTDDVTTDDVEVDDTETIDTTTTTEVNPDVKAVQDSLTQAQAAAQKLGDPKLTDQIGNTITFFTRSHVVEKPNSVAEGEEMEDNRKILDQVRNELLGLFQPYGNFQISDMTMKGQNLGTEFRLYSKSKGADWKGLENFMKNNSDFSIKNISKQTFDNPKSIDFSYKKSSNLKESMFPMLKRILK